MSKTSIDVAALAGAMEVRVKAENISWRTAAGRIGVSPSLLTRLRNGQRPDLEAFAAITRWLGHPADEFFIDSTELVSRPQPPLDSSLNALLRARRDLTDKDKDFLQDILAAGIRHVRQTNNGE
ncbi:helix-turn-helix transcriptional regulator [Rhodococcus sp. ANT_H53B]|nr:helix-turn-helix transcriptional regulator [Rhodococcus sp. ANT_H53B]